MIDFNIDDIEVEEKSGLQLQSCTILGDSGWWNITYSCDGENFVPLGVCRDVQFQTGGIVEQLSGTVAEFE